MAEKDKKTEEGGEETLAGLKARLAELVEQKNDFKAKYEEAQAALDAAGTAHTAELEKLQGQVDELSKGTSKHAMERTLWKADVEYDDDTLDFLALKYDRVEAVEDGEKPSFEEWFGGYRESSPLFKAKTKVEPKDGSKPPAGDPPKDEPEAGDPPKDKPKPSATDSGKPPPAPAELTTEQIMALPPAEYAKWRSEKKIVVR